MVQFKNDAMKISIKRTVDESYDVIFGENLFPQIAENLDRCPIGDKYVIITDSNVKKLYADSLEKILKGHGMNTAIISFEAGEKSKHDDVAQRIIGDMHKLKYGREDAIISLGGGVTGDLAGYIASIFDRGINYIQIPTTTISQTDSSIGGKTAVDNNYGKNLIGTIKQPKAVYIDVATLKTLPEREYISGLAETVKDGVIQDAEFFSYLENNVDKILKRSAESSLYIAKQNCRIKGHVVEQDPNEKGLRRILNYGHTVGHAIEKLSNFSLPHGECVSIGMMVAGRISNALGYLSEKNLARQESVLSALGLPISIPKNIPNELIIEVTTLDKKAKNGRARYVLPIAIGMMNDFDGVYADYVGNDIVIDALNQTRF